MLELIFLDSDGDMLVMVRAALMPGESAFHDLMGDDIIRDEGMRAQGQRL
jgi:hypothetical protein